MQPQTKLRALLALVLLLPVASAWHTADTHISPTRIYTTDGDYSGRVFVNGTLQTNGTQLRYGDAGSPLLGNLTNATLTDYREWILPDASGTVGLTTGSFTPGSVIFADSAGLMEEDNAAFYWDDTNDRLSVGNTTPLTALHVESAGAPARFQRNTTGTVSGLLLYNPNTTNGNGLDVAWETDTTGSGATVRQHVGSLRLITTTHDHATRTSEFQVQLVDAGVFGQRFRVDAGGGINLRGDTNAGFHRSAAATLTTNSTLIIASTKSLTLSPTSTASLPAAATGAIVYDSTTSQYKMGVGASPAYQVPGMLGIAQTWSAVNTHTSRVVMAVPGSDGLWISATGGGGNSPRLFFEDIDAGPGNAFGMRKGGLSAGVLVISGNVTPGSNSGASIAHFSNTTGLDIIIGGLRTGGVERITQQGRALLTYATVASGGALLLTPTATGSLPAAARGAIVYDVTTDQLKVGVGASPTYQTILTSGQSLAIEMGRVVGTTPSIPQGSADQFFQIGGRMDPSGTETFATTRMSESCTVEKLVVFVSANTMDSATLVTLRKNAADEAGIQISIAAGATGTLTDTGSVAFASGDSAALEVDVPASTLGDEITIREWTVSVRC